MWAQSKGLLGDQVSIGGRAMYGFGLGAPGSPPVWSTLTPDQQAWIVATLTKLNDLIYQSTNTKCATWAAPSTSSVAAATGCFQPWYNSMYVGSPGFVQLRTDGVFDADTLQALMTTALIHQTDFPTAYPASAKKGLSYGAMVGIGTAVVAAGGLIYAATRGKKSRRK